ncbi:MAG: hypothetical protein PGN21_03850 [Sphingomonas paucimobilis]
MPAAAIADIPIAATGEGEAHLYDDRILLDLYAAAESEARWTPLLDALCSALSVRSAVVQVVQAAESVSWETWTVRDSLSTAHAARHDACLNQPDSPRYQLPPGRVPGIEISSDHRSFGTQSTLIDDLRRRMAHADLGIGLWASFPIGGDRTFTLLLHRKPGDMRDLSEAEEGDLARLLPHLQQAVRLSARIGALQARTDTLAAVSSHVQAGLLLCGADLSIDWRNAAAIQIFARTALIAQVGGKLRCARPCDGERVRGAAHAVSTGRARVGRVVLIGDDGTTLHLRIARTGDTVGAAPGGTETAPLSVIVSLPDSPSEFDVEDLAALFDLSPAEARLTSAIAGGLSITEYALARGIATGTARVQLNRVLSKTGTQRQADLVRIVYGSAALRGLGPR